MTKTKTERLVFRQVNIFRFEIVCNIFNDYDRELIFSRLKPAFESSSKKNFKKYVPKYGNSLTRAL